jgi:sugar phosphate isomerase/epimerase
MTWTRREILTAATALPFVGAALSAARAEDRRRRLGVVLYSYAIRLAADRAAGVPGLSDPLTFLEHCRGLGAGGIQTGVGARDKEYTAALRKKLDEHGMYLEGSVRLPKDRADCERFAAELHSGREAGATVFRTVLLGGRRYEMFADADAFRRAAEQARRSLTLAEPIARRHDVRLAVENHKDFRAGELADLLKRLDSRHVGACVDTGNDLAMLSDPLEVVQALAPWAFTVHLKDMAVEEYEDGFLLSEVPLGEGILDLPRVVAILRRARPEIRFNLEMITRDPLRVPCLTPKYWATSEDVPGKALARTLALVRRHKPARPLPRISGLSTKEQRALEEKNVRLCLSHAHEHLGL